MAVTLQRGNAANDAPASRLTSKHCCYLRSGERLLALSQQNLIQPLKKADNRPPLRS